MRRHSYILSIREEQDSTRFVRIFVGILKEQLYISVYNSMNGKPKKGKKNQYLSTKGGDNHGFGLSRIDYIVEKNNGFINRQHEDGVFATEILLPMN